MKHSSRISRAQNGVCPDWVGALMPGSFGVSRDGFLAASGSLMEEEEAEDHIVTGSNRAQGGRDFQREVMDHTPEADLEGMGSHLAGEALEDMDWDTHRFQVEAAAVAAAHIGEVDMFREGMAEAERKGELGVGVEKVLRGSRSVPQGMTPGIAAVHKEAAGRSALLVVGQAQNMVHKEAEGALVVPHSSRHTEPERSPAVDSSEGEEAEGAQQGENLEALAGRIGLGKGPGLEDGDNASRQAPSSPETWHYARSGHALGVATAIAGGRCGLVSKQMPGTGSTPLVLSQ